MRGSADAWVLRIHGRFGARTGRSSLSIKMAVAKIHRPIQPKADEVDAVDSQDPVDASCQKLRSDACKVSCCDESDELPAGSGGRSRLIALVGVQGPRKPEADEHGGFQKLCHDVEVASFPSLNASDRPVMQLDGPIWFDSGIRMGPKVGLVGDPSDRRCGSFLS